VLSYEVSGGRNPLTTRVPVNSFKITTKTADDFLLEAVGANAFANPPVSAGKLDVVSVSMDSKVTGKATIVNAKFSLTTQLPVNGRFLISFPPLLFFKDAISPVCLRRTPDATVLQCNFHVKIDPTFGEYVDSVKVEPFCITKICSPNELNEITISGMRTANSVLNIGGSVTLSSLDTQEYDLLNIIHRQ
jgi:hypothetical protein